ncbi:MAG: hypothetical protein A4E35_01246 [Methanoregula sp. PtaU1.Bin051]|nr:MAG: hypothetical protein A4E35_01246 [Methanoregula sp. PtaU1.Bin051]
MKNDAANLSFDFLAGFTVFILAFIWVATMIPGLLIGVSGYSIDYDAIAYRSGVILVEDPGMPVNPPWEGKTFAQKGEVERMGLALTKDTPNILSPEKINRFFSSDFTYPEDYQEKVIFGDRPYQFNVSVMTFDNSTNRSVGSLRPKAYGYIRRFVLVKQMSNATIDSHLYNSSANSTIHIFSVTLNMTRLIKDEKRPEYRIDALREPVTINLTNLKSNLANPATTIELTRIRLWRSDGGSSLSNVPPDLDAYIDRDANPSTPPCAVDDSVSLLFPAGFFSAMATADTKMFVNFTFTLVNTGPDGDRFINSTYGNRHFEYDYDSTRVTQPELKPGVVEVAVW